MAAERPIAALAALIAAAWAGGALATVVPTEPPTVSKPSSRAVAAKQAPTHAWHEAGVRRTLRLESTLEADFSPRVGKDAGVLRPAGAAPKSAAPLVSPVFRDDAGRLRALPGGVLVVLRAPLPEADARALIARAGATPSRALSPTLWVVEAPAGLAALDLANRLHASGAFAAAQPNWWVERTLK
jgi:hypothetical protein